MTDPSPTNATTPTSTNASTPANGDAWDPGQYDRFREERQAPFYDLLKLVHPKKGMRVVDLGCGTGELTREMHRHFKATRTLGLDSSRAMLERTNEINEPGLSFENRDIGAFATPGSRASRDAEGGAGGEAPPSRPRDDDGAWDLVLSNAALHWVPDHERVLARLTKAIAPGGQLAVQMPANQDHPSHTVAEELAKEAPFVAKLAGQGARQHVLPVEQYGRILAKLGFRAQHVRLQVYVHKLASADGVIEWVKGAMLTDFKKRLDDDSLYARFLDEYRARLLRKLDDEKPYLYTFKRILFWAER